MIILVFGLPGSGKSFFASRLAGMLRAEYVSSDALRKTLFDTRTYSMNEKLAVYKEMLNRVREAALERVTLVLDATFYRNDIRNKFLDAANPADRIIFIEVWAEESLIKQRLKKPRQDSDADFEVYKKIKKECEPFDQTHLVLQSTDDNIGEMLEKAVDYLHTRQ
jgi:predicted kinase